MQKSYVVTATYAGTGTHSNDAFFEGSNETDYASGSCAGEAFSGTLTGVWSGTSKVLNGYYLHVKYLLSRNNTGITVAQFRYSLNGSTFILHYSCPINTSITKVEKILIPMGTNLNVLKVRLELDSSGAGSNCSYQAYYAYVAAPSSMGMIFP